MPELYDKISVIGSFPPEPEEGHLEYWLEIQRRAGVDYPCVQGDMISMFLEDPNVTGIEKANGKYRLTDFPSVKGPVQTGYLEEILKKCEEMKYPISGLTIPVSGPFTLGDRIVAPPDLSGEKEEKPLIHLKEFFNPFVEDVVSEIIKKYDARFPGSIIRVDEPIAQTGGLTSQAGYGLEEGYIQEVLDGILCHINRGIPGVHVCGNISGTAIFLSGLKNAKILSHDFSADFPENHSYYSPGMLGDKILGAGIVSSFNPRAEDLTEVKEIYKKMVRRFGKELLHLHPSCGFGRFMTKLRDQRYQRELRECEQKREGGRPKRDEVLVPVDEAAEIIEQKLSTLAGVRNYAAAL